VGVIYYENDVYRIRGMSDYRKFIHLCSSRVWICTHGPYPGGVRMNNFFEEHGNIIVSSVVSLMVLGILVLVEQFVGNVCVYELGCLMGM
jgi:hypothetical protein